MSSIERLCDGFSLPRHLVSHMMAFSMTSSLRIAATKTTFLGLPLSHRRVWKARMAGLYWTADTVAIEIRRTQARLPQIRRLPRSWPRFWFRGATPTKEARVRWLSCPSSAGRPPVRPPLQDRRRVRYAAVRRRGGTRFDGSAGGLRVPGPSEPIRSAAVQVGLDGGSWRPLWWCPGVSSPGHTWPRSSAVS